MLKGLGDIKKNQEKMQELMGKDRINYVFLGDRENALIRFLTDGDDVILANFHTVEEVIPNGKRWAKYYCSQDATCKYCAQGINWGEMIFLWCYCKYILHRQQNPKLDNDPQAQQWKRVKSGDQIFFKEDVNEPRVFRMTPGKGNAYKKALIKYAAEYKTLLDRDYRWEREGSGKETTYTLTSRNPSIMADVVKNIIPTLPILEKVVMGEIVSFNGGSVDVKDNDIEDLEEISESSSDSVEEVVDEENDIEELF